MKMEGNHRMIEEKFLPTVNVIVCIDKNGGIGKNNDLPWGRITEDLRHFKNVTMGNTVIMGRKTFESLPKPLPGRKNLVISRLKRDANDFFNIDVQFANDLHLAIIDETLSGNIPFIIGGSDIFNQIFKLKCEGKIYINTIYVTVIHDSFNCDKFLKVENEIIDFDNMKKLAINYQYSRVILNKIEPYIGETGKFTPIEFYKFDRLKGA